MWKLRLLHAIWWRIVSFFLFIFLHLSCSSLKKLELTEEICKDFFTLTDWHRRWWRAMRYGGNGGREREASVFVFVMEMNRSLAPCQFFSLPLEPNHTFFPLNSLKIKCYPLILILLLRLDLFTSVATPKWNYDLSCSGWSHCEFRRLVWKTMHHVVLRRTFYFLSALHEEYKSKTSNIHDVFEHTSSSIAEKKTEVVFSYWG